MLRTCERMGMREREFYALTYAEQVRCLAFNRVRSMEEAHAGGMGSV